MWQDLSKQPLIIPAGSFIKVNAIVAGDPKVRRVVEVEIKEDLMVEPVSNELFKCRSNTTYYLKWVGGLLAVVTALFLLGA